jgi:hypothetical protein
MTRHLMGYRPRLLATLLALLALSGALSASGCAEPARLGAAAQPLQTPGLPNGLSDSVNQPAGPSARSASNANYVLNATLDVVNHQITGSGTLTWRNTTSTPASELRFHLYWNAWRDDFSSYMREQQRAGMPLPRRGDGDRAWIDLSALSLRTTEPGTPGTDLLARLRFIAPDDGNSADRTLASVALDRPVQPGESIRIDMKWLAHVPRPFDRTGVIGDYYFIAQWFPKIGVLTDDGWRARQFHMTTEYFADFGQYDVRLTVPSGWTVGATGQERGRSDSDGLTVRFVADDVHDFAWTTSPDFIDLRQDFERPDRSPISLRLLLQKEHHRQADRHWAAIRLALERYGEWLGPYPYGQLTVVDPVTIVDADVQGSSTGGMEYPQLITAGTRWTAPWASSDPEDVILHEIGHQYFHTIVATNEVDHAWMDEGLTTYLSSKLMADSYPGRFTRTGRLFGGLVIWPWEAARWTRSVDGDGANRYRTEPDRDVPSNASWQFDPATGRTLTYFRTALWLHTLERMIGWETMRRVLATYYSRSAFTHPEPADFFRTVNEITQQDLTWFFDQVQNRATTFDYGVDRVTTLRLDSGSFDTAVLVRRLGTGVFPIDLRVTFEDGSSVTERWDGTAPNRLFTYRRGVRATRVEVDPDRVLRLDVRQVNNSWTSMRQGRAAGARWGVRWLTWLQHQLLTYAFFI